MNKSISQAALPRSIQLIIEKARAELRPTAILLFGSRASGRSSPTSDFDLAFIGVTDAPAWTRFLNHVEHEAATLYHIDLVLYESAPQALKDSIDSANLVIEEGHERAAS